MSESAVWINWNNLSFHKNATKLHDINLFFSTDSVEKEMATHSSILAWRTPWMEEPGGLQSMGLQRVGHD